MRILTEEIERLAGENEGYQRDMEMYKKKYVEFSNMVERVNNTMAGYVTVCILMESLQNRLNSGGQSNVKARASISEQLKELGGSSSSSTTVTRKVIETEEMI